MLIVKVVPLVQVGHQLNLKFFFRTVNLFVLTSMLTASMVLCYGGSYWTGRTEFKTLMIYISIFKATCVSCDP